MRAIIGDALRRPVLWCQFSPCVSCFTHPNALGERDLRLRALAGGWRYDALGRLACPKCVQLSPDFWPTRPLVPRARPPLASSRPPVPRHALRETRPQPVADWPHAEPDTKTALAPPHHHRRPGKHGRHARLPGP